MEIKKLILIIDDEPDFARVMQLFLETANFRVIISTDPEDGLKKALLRPDLILLDLRMPTMNGHEVCKRLKENRETWHIPIVMLTSQAHTIDKVEAFNLGVSDYIIKDSPFEEMLARIKSVLKKSDRFTSLEIEKERNEQILELRKIIDEKYIRSLYQPILELKTKKVIGYEALTRGPKDSILENPVNLFTLAYDVDMFFELDTLCRNLSVKRASFLKPEDTLFLNTDPGIIDTAHFRNMEFLQNTPIRPPQICLEITERTCIKNFMKLSSELNNFRLKGSRIAIDDVGEGYSSLKAIVELKPDFLKIDISLVRDIDSDKVKSSLVALIVDLARKVDSKLIAEGIETEKEHAVISSLGVEYGQGFLFAKPSENIQA